MYSLKEFREDVHQAAAQAQGLIDEGFNNISDQLGKDGSHGALDQHILVAEATVATAMSVAVGTAEFLLTPGEGIEKANAALDKYDHAKTDTAKFEAAVEAYGAVSEEILRVTAYGAMAEAGAAKIKNGGKVAEEAPGKFESNTRPEKTSTPPAVSEPPAKPSAVDVRTRIEKNISESKAARQSSNYRETTPNRPATQQPRGGKGIVLRDAEGATAAEIAASSGGETAGIRGPKSISIREQLKAQQMKESGEMTCWRCGQTTTNPANIHLGHRNVPVSRGGNLAPENVCLEGAACNLGSGGRGLPKPGMSCAERGSCGAPYGRSD